MSAKEFDAPSVLVVVRRPEVRRRLEDALRCCVPPVRSLEVVDTAEAGAGRVAEGGIDVVIVDVVPTDMSDLVTVGRDVDRRRRVPLVAVAFGDRSGWAADAVSAGADEVLSIDALSGETLAGALRTARVRLRQVRRIDDERDLDEISGLGSRRWILERLEVSVELAESDPTARGLAVLLVDLDRFKLVNDTFGHSVGDELLRAVGERLAHVVRADDPLARLGGDEFAIAMSSSNVHRLAPMVAHRVIGALRDPFRVAGHTFSVHASVGISLFVPGDTTADMLEGADAALYAAKTGGRNRVAIYDDSMREQTLRHRRSAVVLSDAIAHDRLGVTDDVLVDLGSGAAVGHSLSPQWGDLPGVSNSDLLDVARRSGQAPDLGRWMVATALRRCAAAGPGSGQALVSIPSGLMCQPTFGVELVRLAEAHDVDPASVVLLMDEGDFDEVELVGPVIDTLASEGFGIGVNDFGAGRSSLVLFGSDLVDYVKLAPNLTVGLTSNSAAAGYVRGLAAIADAVGQHLIASEVTDTDQLDTLAKLGCHLAIVEGARSESATGWIAPQRVDLRRPLQLHPSESGLPGGSRSVSS